MGAWSEEGWLKLLQALRTPEARAVLAAPDWKAMAAELRRAAAVARDSAMLLAADRLDAAALALEGGEPAPELCHYAGRLGH